MTIKKTTPTAAAASDFGVKTGYIHPKGGLLERRDKEEGLHLVFTMVVFAVVDEFFGEVKSREFEVWAQGEDVKTLKNAFPDGVAEISKEQALVAVDVADEWYSNYKNENGQWINVIGLRARSVTLPNVPN